MCATMTCPPLEMTAGDLDLTLMRGSGVGWASMLTYLDGWAEELGCGGNLQCYQCYVHGSSWMLFSKEGSERQHEVLTKFMPISNP